MSPYKSLPDTAFWKPAVSSKSLFDIGDLWRPKYPITSASKIATFGSCFAQHFSRELQARQYQWMNTEPAPFGLSAENQKRFNYGVFSCRTTNIYTTSLLRQWVEFSLGLRPQPSEIWCGDGRFRDPLRPAVEPDGFASEAEMLASRDQTLKSFREIILTCDVFVFTMGLTESWVNVQTGYEYQLCPGTSGGEFDPAAHRFINQDYITILQNITFVIDRIREVNPQIKFLLTVSPVPLTATMSGQHVLVATMASKSILRAVCAQIVKQFQCVDYFPSYEIINSPAFKGSFYEPNLRNVHRVGVDFVMKTFFEALSQQRAAAPPLATAREAAESRDEELVCEEQLLAAFAS